MGGVKQLQFERAELAQAALAEIKICMEIATPEQRQLLLESAIEEVLECWEIPEWFTLELIALPGIRDLIRNHREPNQLESKFREDDLTRMAYLISLAYKETKRLLTLPKGCRQENVIAEVIEEEFLRKWEPTYVKKVLVNFRATLKDGTSKLSINDSLRVEFFENLLRKRYPKNRKIR